MKILKYPITNSLEWIKLINQSIPSSILDNKLILKKEIGNGEIEVIPIQAGLDITFIDIKLETAIKLRRIAGSSNDYFILNFYLSKTLISQKIEQEQELEYDHFGILLSSKMTASESILPPNVPIKIFNITFSRKWLFDNVLGSNQDAKLYQIFSKEDPIYIFENLNYTFNTSYRSVVSSRNDKGKIWLTSNVLNMLTHFFERIESRPLPFSNLNINATDITNLLVVKNNIEANWDQQPTNEALAKLAKMSQSKFKKLFKQLFGESPYQYYLKMKMNKAMNLLAKKDLSVSDVGYLLGYKNLSQFSKAFKKIYNILPKEVK